MKNKIILLSVFVLFSAAAFCADAAQAIAAARDIKAGEQITADMLKPRDVSAGDLQQDFIPYKDMKLFTDGASFTARIDIPKNAQVIKSALSAARGKNEFSSLSPGWRGYFLETDAATAQIVKAEDLVDVLVYANLPPPIVFTLFQKVRVLGVTEQGGKKYLYLSIAPKDAQYLFLAEKKAEKIKIVLRNQADIGVKAIRILPADGE